MSGLIAYGAALATMVVLDGVWLGVVASRLYAEALGPLLADPPNLLAAAAFYLLYPVGLVVFTVRPAARPITALARGALFGLVAYATYDLTNLATLKGFPLSIALVDMAWGAVITGCASAIARRVAPAT